MSFNLEPMQVVGHQGNTILVETSEEAYSQLDNSFLKKELMSAHIHGRYWVLNQIS
jgi:hypothetical protein